MKFEVVPVPSGLIGGHFAVRAPYGKLIGATWRLDRATADELRRELEAAHDQGVTSG